MIVVIVGVIVVAAAVRSIWIMAVEQAAFENENEKVADQKHKEDLESPQLQEQTPQSQQPTTQPTPTQPTQPTPPLPGHSFPTPPRSVRKLNGVVVAEVELECN
jgi:cell division protein FtsN